MNRSNPFASTILLAAFFIVSCAKQTNMAPTDAGQLAASSANANSITLRRPVFWGQALNMPLPSGGFLGRYMPYTFSMPGKAFVGGGQLATSTGVDNNANDLWMYDTLTHTWTQMPSLPSTGTTSVTCFTIGGSAYVLTWALSYNEFWQYNYQSNTWTRKKDFPGAPRSNATSIAVNGKGYLGLGELAPEDSQFWYDWWQYDPATDSWTQKAGMPGNGRWGAVAFASSTNAYICGGMNMFQGYFNDCWGYDPVADTWTQQASLPAAGRAYAVGMSTPTVGIVGTGYNGTSSMKDCWQFVFSNNSWNQIPSVPTIRHGAAGVAVGSMLFVGGGRSGGATEAPADVESTLDDWRFLRW